MIKLLSHYTTNWKELADINVPIMQEYCDRHGYELCVREGEPYDKYDGLVKLQMILDELKEGDIGLVMDMDAIITNFGTEIEDCLIDGRDIFVARGGNMGVFIIRMTDFSRSVIEKIILWIKVGQSHCEQDAFEFWVKTYSLEIEREYMAVLTWPQINAFIPELYGHIEKPEEITREKGRWVPGSFICHLPALSMETRLSKMKELKEQIIR